MIFANVYERKIRYLYKVNDSGDEVIGSSDGEDYWRWRTASYMRIAAETETFRESICPNMGMRI